MVSAGEFWSPSVHINTHAHTHTHTHTQTNRHTDTRSLRETFSPTYYQQCCEHTKLQFLCLDSVTEKGDRLIKKFAHFFRIATHTSQVTGF